MDLWKEVQQVFDAALQRPPEKRHEFLEQECGSNHELRREVESLLAAHDESGSFMAKPAAVAGVAHVLHRATSRFQPGDALGAYKILDLVGRGGMGEVYRARDTRLKRDVAIKVLPQDFAADQERLRRFEQEARSAAALNHPNIISVHEMGMTDGSPYIVSELLEGQNLREALRHGAVPSRKALDYATQAARGLAAAHDHGVVHRDLKPENLFITTDGGLKILDFGLAKLTRLEAGGSDSSMAEAGPRTEPGRVFGTVGYMSPEQVRGQSADHRSDIFSFGAILYELFSGKRAFTGDSPADTMSAILHLDPPQLTRGTPPVHPAVELTIRHCLEKNPLERFQSAHDLAFQLEEEKRQSSEFLPRPTTNVFARHVLQRYFLVALVLVCTLAISLYFHFRPVRGVTEKDTIVLADVTNTTGDDVFNDTVKEALAIKLEQSPSLNFLAEHELEATLKQMGRTREQPLIGDLAREVCERVGSKALVTGSIGRLDNEYVVGIKVLNCVTGDILVHEQIRADGKEQVLKALDETTAKLRSKLGESISSVQKYDTPLAQATTPSLEALRAYSLGAHAATTTASLPFFKNAVALDSNFALAYVGMGQAYFELGQLASAAQALSRAFELRDRVSERERLIIESQYYTRVTGELEKAEQVYQLWQQNYPRDPFAYSALGVIYGTLGKYNKALQQTLRAMQVDPNTSDDRLLNLGIWYGNLNLLDEAEAAFKQAERKQQRGESLLAAHYQMAFMKDDFTSMARLVETAEGKPGAADLLLGYHADTEVWYGHVVKARELTQRAIALALFHDAKETAAGYQAESALREAELGNLEQARADAHSALKRLLTGMFRPFRHWRLPGRARLRQRKG